MTKWIPILLSVLITVGGVSGTWAVYGERIEAAKEEREELKAEHKNFVTREVLTLTLKPIVDSQQTMQGSIDTIIRKLDNRDRELLEAIKSINNEPPGAHTR